MGVYIQDMKMPENCVECKLADRYSPNECPFYTIYKSDHLCKRFNKCPLVDYSDLIGKIVYITAEDGFVVFDSVNPHFDNEKGDRCGDE